MARAAGQPGAAGRRGRYLFAVTGSLGELLPFVTIASAMQARGHDAVLATSSLYRDIVEQAGLGFRRLRPDLSRDEDFNRKVWDPKTGGRFWFQEVMGPAIRAAYEDLEQAAADADVLVSRHTTAVDALVAERTGTPWVSVKFSPCEFVSACDPVSVPRLDWLLRPLARHPALLRPLFGHFKSRFRDRNLAPLKRLRDELGMPPSSDWRLWGDVAPVLELAMFPDAFARPQPDWPHNVRQTGFPKSPSSPELDRDLDETLAAFLDAGPAPIAFCIGSRQLGARDPAFLVASLDAARAVGRRAVLMTGGDLDPALAGRLAGDDVCAVAYAPHARLFPRTAAIVHHGGIGTIASALMAGKPQVVVPFMFDQPDNAARLKRMGVAETVPHDRYDRTHAARALSAILGQAGHAAAAEKAAALLAGQDGVTAACIALEEVLAGAQVSGKAA